MRVVESLDGHESVFCQNVIPDSPPTRLVSVRQEALHREQMLEQKLATLQRLLANTQEASESSWQVGNATTILKVPKVPDYRQRDATDAFSQMFLDVCKHPLFFFFFTMYYYNNTFICVLEKHPGTVVH